jgi:hypothetical protein
MLYPLEKRLPNTFGLFMNTNTGSVQEPYAPGEKPGEARRIYNWWIELGEYEYLAQNEIFFKSPVTKDFTEHFLFLTDREIANLRKWAKSKGKDVMKIDLEACREFWSEYSQ